MPERTPDGKEWIQDVRARTDALGLPHAKAESLLEEVAQHLDERVADLQRSGVSESEARRLALDEVFEDERLVGEETTGAAAGDTTAARATGLGATDASALSTTAADGLVRDVRYAVRMLGHQRGYAAAAALALAVGIRWHDRRLRCRRRRAAATDAVPARRSAVRADQRQHRPAHSPSSRSFADVEDWRNTGLFAEVAVWRQGASDLTGAGDPERVRMAIVSEQFFRLIDVTPAAGRTLLPADHAPGAPQVIVITHALWQQRFGGAADVIGRRVTLGGDAFEIVGVLCARQVWPEDVALFLPMNTALFGADELTRRDNLIFNALARLPEGVSADRVRARMTEIAARLERDHPRERRGWTNTLVPLREYIVDANTSLALYVLLAAVAGVLLIACANVANLALVRGSGRARELAVRLSLGASRGRLLQQLLIEGVLVLAAVGVAAGVGLAYFLMPGLVAMAPQGTPFLDDVRLNGRVLLAAVVAGGVTAIIAGLVPALSSAPALQLTGALRDGSAGGGTSRRTTRLRHLLVMAEIAATVVLVTGSALLIRSFDRLTRVNPGVTLDRVVSGRIAVPAARYPTPARRLQFADYLVARLEARADIESAALTSFVPAGAGGFGLGRSFLAEGRPDDSELNALWNTVTPHYFRTMGIPIVEGRSFDTRDQANATPVMIVSKWFAERMFPGEPAIGKRVKSSRDEKVYREIVGIADEVTYWGLAERRRAPLVYVPSAQDDQFGGLIVARSRGDDAGSIVTSVRHALAQVDPAMAIAELRTLEVSANCSIATERYATLLLTILAAVALTLSALGIYGVMSYSFELRRKEMGIRLALGASRGNLYALVFRHGIVLTLVGLVIGVAVGRPDALARSPALQHAPRRCRRVVDDGRRRAGLRRGSVHRSRAARGIGESDDSAESGLRLERTKAARVAAARRSGRPGHRRLWARRAPARRRSS